MVGENRLRAPIRDVGFNELHQGKVRDRIHLYVRKIGEIGLMHPEKLQGPSLVVRQGLRGVLSGRGAVGHGRHRDAMPRLRQLMDRRSSAEDLIVRMRNDE